MKPYTKQWWRRAAAAAKDQQSIYLSSWAAPRRGHRPEMEAAVIKATSHDDASIDYKNSRRVFAWARASPSSFIHPLMSSLSRRASRTRSWPVALKSLLLAHGLLLLLSSPSRLPFDLSDFQDRSPRNWGFSAFVRAYFSFLDFRSRPCDEEGLKRIENLQSLLDLLIQIRPSADGMIVALVLEAMDCAIIEIFDVYSGICNGIAAFLVGLQTGGQDEVEERRKMGAAGIRVLRKAAEQSEQLSGYFDLCRRLGVVNAAELLPVERIPEKDVVELEKLVMGFVNPEQEVEVEGEEEASPGDRPRRPETVVTEEWEVFEEEGTEEKGKWRNPFELPKTWASVAHRSNVLSDFSGNLLE